MSGLTGPLRALLWRGIVVDPADHAPGEAFLLPAMKSEIDGGAAAEVSKIGLGKGPAPPVPIDPANQPIFNGLGHFFASASVRKNTTFFLQEKGETTANGVSTILKDVGAQVSGLVSLRRSDRCVRLSILRWMLDMVEHVHAHRRFVGLELDPKLLLQRLLKGWAGYIGWSIGARNC
jgi:hypothetical protein